jgi:ferritin-like metal-binding protein YciE
MRIEQDTNQKKVPQPWKKWILLLAIIQILTVSQMWQMNQKIWKTLVHQSQDVIQLGDCLSDHLRNENRHIEAMNQLLEEYNQKLEEYLKQISTNSK